MTQRGMNVRVDDRVYEVDYTVTSEGTEPSGYGFDGSADMGDPLEFYVATVDGREAKTVDARLLERIEEYIHEHHEPDTGYDDYYD